MRLAAEFVMRMPRANPIPSGRGAGSLARPAAASSGQTGVCVWVGKDYYVTNTHDRGYSIHHISHPARSSSICALRSPRWGSMGGNGGFPTLRT
jgi:hypothetical protein